MQCLEPVVALTDRKKLKIPRSYQQFRGILNPELLLDEVAEYGEKMAMTREGVFWDCRFPISDCQFV